LTKGGGRRRQGWVSKLERKRNVRSRRERRYNRKGGKGKGREGRRKYGVKKQGGMASNVVKQKGGINRNEEEIQEEKGTVRIKKEEKRNGRKTEGDEWDKKGEEREEKNGDRRLGRRVEVERNA